MKRKRVRIKDISISYLANEVVSPKATLLFIHGFPFNKNVWVSQFNDLHDDVNLIAVDVRGHGATTSGHGFFNMDVFADDLIVFIEKLELTNTVICGCSMGGYIALRAYEKKPSLFAGLILSDTHSFADDNDAKYNRFATIQAVLSYGKRVFSIGFASKVLSQTTVNEKPEVVEQVKSAIRRNGERDICATLMALASRTDTTSSLKEIKVPVLIIRGEEDQLVSMEKINHMVQEIHDVKYVEITGCGHLPNLENPNRFNGELKNFLISKIL